MDNSSIGMEQNIDNDNNNKTRYSKIISFFINNKISYSYSMQLLIEIMKLIKNLLKTYLQGM